MPSEWSSSEEPQSAICPSRSLQMFESRSSSERVWKSPRVKLWKGCGRRTAWSILPTREMWIWGKKKNQTTWKHGKILFQTQVVNMYLWVLDPTAITGTVQIIALFVPRTCAPFFHERAWITEIWWLFSFCPALNLMSEEIYGPPCWQTGPDGCLNKLTRLLIFYLFFHRVCFISRTLTWGGVLLIPRSADEWRQGQTHMHVRLASIHLLSSGGGGQHQTNEGAIWLPPRQRHALPSS